LFLRLFTQTPFATPWIESQPAYVIASGLLLIMIVVVWCVAVPRGAGPLMRADSDLVAQSGLLLWAESGLMLGLLYSYGPLAEANHLFMLLPGIVASIRLATGSPNRAVKARWRPAAVAWGIFLLAIVSPLRAFTWTHPIEAHLEGPAVILTGRLGLLMLAAALVMAWSRWRERQATATTAVA
jgi:hypothetical protein